MGFIFGSSRTTASKAASPVAAPAAAPVIRMPVENSASTRAANERKRRQIFGRSGRRSTILTRRDGGEAGIGAYSNSLLGQAG